VGEKGDGIMRWPFGGGRIGIVLALYIAIFVLACAGPGKRLESPRISLAHLEVQEAQVFETVFQIALRVFNTNDVPLEVKGIDCSLELNGKDFAHGVSDVNVLIPAHGTERIPMTVYSSLVDMARGLLRAQSEEKLKYKIKGRLRLEGGFMVPSTIPFSTEGEISLKGPS
jgi:LEA14-like dessication related protein